MDYVPIVLLTDACVSDIPMCLYSSDAFRWSSVPPFSMESMLLTSVSSCELCPPVVAITTKAPTSQSLTSSWTVITLSSDSAVLANMVQVRASGRPRNSERHLGNVG